MKIDKPFPPILLEPVLELPAWVAAESPWDAARKLSVVRHDYRAEGEVIDKGVNFFVLTLEAMGAVPRYSCEGHPNGFYVMFEGPYELALKIDRAGFFSTEICSNRSTPSWVIRRGHTTSIRERNQSLRWAAGAWKRKIWNCHEQAEYNS